MWKAYLLKDFLGSIDQSTRTIYKVWSIWQLCVNFIMKPTKVGSRWAYKNHIKNLRKTKHYLVALTNMNSFLFSYLLKYLFSFPFPFSLSKRENFTLFYFILFLSILGIHISCRLPWLPNSTTISKRPINPKK